MSAHHSARPVKAITLAGLANRLRHLDCAIDLAAKLERPVELIWPIDRDLNCPFDRLFCVPDTVVRIVEQSHGNYPFHDKILRRIGFPGRHYLTSAQFGELQVGKRVLAFDHATVAKHLPASDALIFRSGMRSYLPEKPYAWFSPTAKVLDRVATMTAGYSAKMLGVHVRRTDHVHAIRHSPLEAFIAEVDRKIAKEGFTGLFLATDDDAAEQAILGRYPAAVIYRKRSRDRNDPAAIEDALVDFICLSRTAAILGSAGSSFSEEAATLGAVTLEIAS
ncbi:hypothetical protein [Martelella sp. HB161492]|uniref:hypothetical protein n=1 Tax=Martelella sp. HB161492 TaxID=2720726 RepID=UPI001590DF5E|nr:hypothetical protein [Martelella sp. HB161492]